jgi:hypothetical protein
MKIDSDAAHNKLLHGAERQFPARVGPKILMVKSPLNSIKPVLLANVPFVIEAKGAVNVRRVRSCLRNYFNHVTFDQFSSFERESDSNSVRLILQFSRNVNRLGLIQPEFTRQSSFIRAGERILRPKN